MKKVRNMVCVGLAFLSLGIGCVGIVFPILPTTPFFLLALCLFARGSERFHRWFLSTGLYKKYLEDFVKTKTMTGQAKKKVLAAVTILLAMGFCFSPVPAKVIIVVVLAGHYIYFLFGVRTADSRQICKTGDEE